jgi:hypothetical protein
MTRFTDYAHDLSDQEFLERDHQLAQQAERRIEQLDNAWEYERDNWVEAHEFAGPKPPSKTAMQQELDFTEDAA